jgi:hypothetical protein
MLRQKGKYILNHYCLSTIAGYLHCKSADF